LEKIAFESAEVLLILLPGFVTSSILVTLTVRPSQTDFDKLIEALFFSFFIYVVCTLVPWTSGLPIVLAQSADSTNNLSVAIDLNALRSFVLTAFILAVIIGLFVSYLNTNDVLTKYLRRLSITRRSSRISVWSDVFHDVNSYVFVEFADGRRVRGWPTYFSDTPEEASIFLEQAAWLNEDGTAQEIDGAGILITKNMPIQNVSFVSPVKANP
jgi:uncharacterized protein DUF6338